MIRFNFINEFKDLAKDYLKKSNKKSLSNEDFSLLNKEMFKIIQDRYKKEIPYAIVEYSEELERDIIKYIPNKDLNEKTFKKYGIDTKYTENLKDYVKQKDIPLENYFLEIDSGRIPDILRPKSKNKIEVNTFMVDGTIDIEKYTNCSPKESKFKINDLDGMTFLLPDEKGLYFFSTDADGINSIIMFEVKNAVYSLNYVTTANRSRGQGLSIDIYRTAMNYIKEQGGILIRSEPSQLGAAFIEDKITNMLKSEFPNEPILSNKTKDLNFYIRLLSSDLNENQMAMLKNGLIEVLDNRKYITKVNVLGEGFDYEITQEMTERDKDILTNSLKERPKNIKKHKP